MHGNAPYVNENARQESAAARGFFRIGEVCRLTDTKPFVLRYWETEFPMLQPVKSPKGHRLYRHEDVETVRHIKHLLYDEGFTIAGARRHLSEGGGRRVSRLRRARGGELRQSRRALPTRPQTAIFADHRLKAPRRPSLPRASSPARRNSPARASPVHFSTLLKHRCRHSSRAPSIAEPLIAPLSIAPRLNAPHQ